MLNKFTFSVIPTINPDGFVYSQSHRMWRKNRQPVGHKSCVGIDLNSNWAYKWKKEKKEKPCNEGYRGKAAFEAYETKAVGEWLAKGAERGTRVRAFIDLHSYGQLCKSLSLHPSPQLTEMTMQSCSPLPIHVMTSLSTQKCSWRPVWELPKRLELRMEKLMKPAKRAT